MAGSTDLGEIPSRRERLNLLALWLLLAVWIVGGAYGRIVPETKLGLTWEPLRFLTRAASAWDPWASFGRLQNQSVGYLFPMGTITGAARALGVPVWLAQRLWLTVLFGAALFGMHRLARALGIRGASGRVLAALVYTLAPSVLLVASYHGGTALPHALAPWMLVPLVDHERLGPRRAALRSALAIACMGGVNAASTLAVIPLALVWFLTRQPGPSRRCLFAWWVGGVVAATAWWLVPFAVSVRHGFDFTPFTEQIDLTASTQSAADAWRGTGHWLTYIDQGGRVLQPGGQSLILDGRAILGSMLLVILGAIGLTARDAPGRRWLIPTAALGAIALAAVYTGPGNAGPIASGLRSLFDGPFVAFRNLHKFAPLVQLPLALGVGHAVTLFGARLRRPHRALVPIGVGFALLAAISPMIPGRLFLPGSFVDLPEAWYDASAWADSQIGETRTLLLPGSISADHRWGTPQDEPFGLLSDTAWAVRDIIPLGGNGSTRLLDGFDEALRRGAAPVGFTDALRRAGVGRLIVRNDLVDDGDGAPSPARIRRVLEQTPGVVRGPSFGPVVDPPHPSDTAMLEPVVSRPEPIRQLDTYLIEDPVEEIAAMSLSSVAAIGGASEALLHLPPELVDDRPLVFADDRSDLPDDAVVDLRITTDTARHRDVLFGGIRSNTSATLEIGDEGPLTGGAPRERWPDPTTPPRTVAVLDGVAALGEIPTNPHRPPGGQPFAAFDSDPETMWIPAEPVVGSVIEVQFGSATNVPSVTVTVPSTRGRRVTDVVVEHDGGSAPGRVGDDGMVTVALDSPSTRSLRIRISGMVDGPVHAPVGLSDVQIEGVSVRRPLRTASSTAIGSEPADAAVLDRARSGIGAISGVDEDGDLDRLVSLTDGPKGLTGTATAVGGPALDELLHPPSRDGAPVWGGSWSRLPGHGPAAAFDGRPDTAWAVAPAATIDDAAVLTWAEVRPIDTLTIGFADDPAAAVAGDVEVGITVDGERYTQHPDHDGTVVLTGDAVDRLAIDLRAHGASAGRPILVPSITVDGRPVTVDDSDADTAVDLPCGSGPPLEVDGRSVPTSLQTTTGAIRRGEPARWEACDTPSTTGDETRIRAPYAEPFRIDTIVASGAIAPAPGAPRTVDVTSWGSQQRHLRVGPGPSIAVVGTENHNRGWAARGADDLRPLRVDGWRQAFTVPAADEPLELTLVYEPNSLFRTGLVAGFVLLIALVVGAALRPRRPVPMALTERGPSSTVAAGLAGLVGLLLGGALVLVTVPLAVLGRRRPDLLRWMAPVALGVLALLLLAPIGSRWASTNAAFHAPAQIAAVIAWIAFSLRAAD